MDKVDAWGMQAILTAALASLAVYAGAIVVPLFVLLGMMVIDYTTGMVAAWLDHRLSSKVGVRGIVKKVGYMALITVAMGVDYLIASGVAAAAVSIEYRMGFGLLVTIWLLINEMISVLENLKNMGVPLPEFLVKVISRLRQTIDKKEDKSDD